MQNLLSTPEFTWSHSRDRLLDECARAYYWRYYGSHGGWSDAAGAETRLAWRLKHLTTLHSVLGAAVHEQARQCAVAVRERRPRPTAGEMGEQVRAALRAACLSSDRPAFLQDPKGRPMLRAVYYDGRYDRGEVSAVAAKVEPCVRHLHASTLWDRLAAVPPESVVLVEAHDFVEWEGVRVYAGPGAPLDPYQVAREVSNADLRLIIKRFTGECSGAGSGWRNWRFGLTPSVRDSSPRLTRAICRHSELRIERTVSASVWCNGSSLPQRE